MEIPKHGRFPLMFRNIVLITSIVYPVFWYIVHLSGKNLEDPLYLRLSVSAMLILLYVFSYTLRYFKAKSSIIILIYTYIITIHSIYLCYINIYAIEYSIYLMANILLSISISNARRTILLYLLFNAIVNLFIIHIVLELSYYIDSIYFIIFCLIFYAIQSDKIRYKKKLKETEFVLRETNKQLEQKISEKTKEYIKLIEELGLSEQQFYKAFHLNPEMTSITTLKEGVFLEVNNVFLETTGYTRDEIIGKSSIELGLWYEEEERELLKYLIRKDKRVKNLEVTLKIKSGELFYILFSAEMIELNGKECLISIAINITKRKLLEQETKRALEKEKEISELRTRFISMVSHEFKTPLTSIKSCSQLLQKNFDRWPQEKVKKYILNIIYSVNRMNELLENTLFMGKAEMGKIEFFPEFIDLESLLEEILDEIHFNFKENLFKIHLKISDNCHRVYIDATIIRHILLNLLSNAIKYSKKEILNDIQLLISCTKEYVYFEIEDHGIGIPEKDQKYLFQPFHRSSNVGNTSGTGIGMVVVKKFVDIHKGNIEIVSQENKGTKIFIRIPLLKKE